MVLSYPIRKDFISQTFGRDCTKDSLFSKFYILFDFKHPGVDFSIPIGTKVKAALPGIVVRKEFHKGMGSVIGTRHGNIVVLYAHLSNFKLQLGQVIKTGELVGFSGNTGAATTEPHLHFEIRDITRENLKDMVFDPPFGKKIEQFQNKFTYKVDNKNTNKTLELLALRYFGAVSYSKKILKSNPKLESHPKKVIKNGTIIIIPNY